MAMLRLAGVRKHFGDLQVLRGIDLEVDEQQVVCLIGASGSGKSTLLRCLNLLETLDDGSIWLDGKDISDPRVDADEVRRDVGIVFQSYNLFPHMTVLRNVTLGPRRSQHVDRSAAEARGLALLERFGLAAKARSYPDSLSGGQQQRVAVIRAVAMAPRLLLLDEITSALDPLLVVEVLEVIADLKRDGMTIVMATHEMDFARQVADRVVYLEGGVVVEDGPPAEVFTAPTDPRTARFLARYLSR